MKFFIFLAGIILSPLAQADTKVFPIDKIPEIAMSDAINIIKIPWKKFSGKDFCPRDASLLGGESQGSGCWTFKDVIGDKVYTILIYFPENTCYILDASNGKFVYAFKKDGTILPIDKINIRSYEDPFEKQGSK